ncbi:putative ABC transporter permease [Brotaphodocola sp.]|uniref:putative ABC transporter permease n=1 Tax=Brotaphodocola sp. TaxID=3073577 RepID=UPI003D7E0EB3
MSHIKDMEKIKRLPGDFLKCGITGWCLEVIFTSVESILNHDWRLMGRTSLLMFPIYGCGALLGPLGSLADKWIGESDLRTVDRMIRHGMIYMVLIFTAEYLSGSFLRARGICPWDYTGKTTNVDGLIRLDFAPLWFGAGLLFEQITKKRGR